MRHPQTTVRWRLTLLYGGLFLACGAVLLAITYALVAHAGIQTTCQTGHGCDGGPGATMLRQLLQLPAAHRLLDSAQAQRILSAAPTHVRIEQRVADLRHLAIQSGIALGIMALASTLLGWLVAGRVLRPVQAITAAARQISDTSLDQRLALGGPRDELRELADTIDELLARLEAAFDAQRLFVANASHELRTPLTTMRAMLDVAAAKPRIPAPQRVLDGRLRGQLDQADGLLESFLALARAQHGELDERSSVPLTDLITDALAVRGEAITAKRIRLHTELTPLCVAGSRTLLARMLENVIENAVRHNQADGLINITSRRERDTAVLVVENGGQVLDPAAVAQLARPFRRLAAERTGSHNGHGLGLSIVAAVAAAHGGTLELSARAEGGLRVQITLPVGALTPPVALPV